MQDRPEFDAYADSYSGEIDKSLAVFGNDHRFFVESKAEELGRIFDSLGGDTANLQVLDAGCGVGLVHPYIVGSVRQLHGLEVSEDSLEIARQHNPGVQYDSYDGDVFPYPDEAFDCAYAICVLHHVPVVQWQSFMREMHRVVKPGGVVAIIEHNPLNPATQWIVNTCPIDKDAHLVTPWRLKALMTAAGLKPRNRFILFMPFRGSFFRMVDRALAWLPFGAQYVMTGRRPLAVSAREET